MPQNQCIHRQRKVVHLTSVHSASDVRIFYKQCRSLASAGYSVILVAPSDRDCNVDGVTIRAVRRIENRLLRMTACVWSVTREALRADADVYHFHDPELMPSGLLLRSQGKVVIYDIHEELASDIEHSKPYIPSLVRPAVRWLADRFERASARRFSALVAATSAISEKFSTLNRNTVAVRNFPVAAEFEARSDVIWAERLPAIAYIGGITRERGLREITQALALLPGASPVRLQLAGSFWPESYHEELSGLPGWKRVDEWGVVERHRLPGLLSQVQAGLVTYHPLANHVHAEPNKLFEYMSAGIPVIASDFPLWREVVAQVNCGLLVDPLNPAAIAEAITYLMTHPAEAEAMGRRGLESVRNKYNWLKEEQKLLELYAALKPDSTTKEACAAITEEIEVIA